MTDELPDTFNLNMVGIQQGKVVVLSSPHMMTADEALVFAAYLVTMAECVAEFKIDTKDRFQKILAKVENT